MEETVEKIINYAIAQVKDFSHQERWAILDEVSHRLTSESETELKMEFFMDDPDDEYSEANLGTDTTS